MQINKKVKICDNCKKEKIIWKRFQGKKLCKECSFLFIKPKKIKKVSNKSRDLHKLYSELRLKFLSVPGNDVCNAKLPGCFFKEHLTIHHKKGRGKYYLDASTWVTLCFNCHRYIEDHPAEAMEMGLTETRLKRDDNNN